MVYATDNETLEEMLAQYQELIAHGQERPLSADEAQRLFATFSSLVRRFKRVARVSDKYQEQLKSMLARLDSNLAGATFLSGTLHICAACKKLQTDDGNWKQFEQYISERSGTFFSHGLCPKCAAHVEGSEITAETVPEYLPLQIAEADMEDMVIVRYMHLFTNNFYERSELYQELRDLFARYLHQSRRLRRIARISDNYQIELRKLSEQMTLASRTDSLTGINNRGYFLELLTNEIERSERHGYTFSFAILDFDHFKEVNDTYGHATGDAVLQAFVDVFRECQMRQYDFWGRLGGEEFGLVLPDTPQQLALNPTERIRKCQAESSINYQGHDITVTVSIGISQYVPGDTVETLLQRADQALYTAKREGRNRVCLG